MTYTQEEINKLFIEQEKALSLLTIRVSALEQILVESGIIPKQKLAETIDGLCEEFARMFNEAVKNSGSEGK